MSESKSVMSRDAVCAFLGIGKKRFYKLVKEGLPVTKLAGGWAGNLDEIDRFIRERTKGKKRPKKD